MDEKIDFIIAWVDGDDPQRKTQRDKYAWADPEDTAKHRFRDWGNLKYLFRWIDKFAPWVNNIFFVTCEQYPEWLNLDHPKLKVITHKDYIPHKYLPTFNANPIELNFHRIGSLSEHFVYFNDDMFIINHVKKSDFFEFGLPKQIAWLDTIPTNNEIFGHIILNDIQLINRHFSYKKLLKKNIYKWYHFGYGLKTLVKTIFLQNSPYLVWFNNPHLPNPLLKSTMNKLWEEEYKLLDDSSKSKFREKSNINQYVFSRYDIASGKFMPWNTNTWRHFSVKNNDNTKLIKSITKQKYKMICINDSGCDFDFQKAKSDVITAFETILPEKSGFEK